MLGAVALGAIGYAEGGVLARDMGGSRVICWALVLSLPLTLPLALVAAAGSDSRRPTPGSASPTCRVVSMFLAFFAWYAGLARGGVAKIGQVQLVQPLLTLGWAALPSASTWAPPRWSPHSRWSRASWRPRDRESRTPLTVRGGQDGGRGRQRDTRTTRSLIVLGDDRFPAASVAAIVAR